MLSQKLSWLRSSFMDKFVFEQIQNNLMISETLHPYLVYLKKEIKKDHLNTPLVIFDIDGTLVNFVSEEGIEPTIDFLHEVQKIGYSIVLLTGRIESMKTETIKLLNKLGVKNYDQIIFRSNNTNNIGDYKLNERKKLATKYSIVANVGDMIHDFKGGFNGKIIKIPY